MDGSGTYLEAETMTSLGSNGVNYAYRRLGRTGGRPLVLPQHFRENLDASCSPRRPRMM